MIVLSKQSCLKFKKNAQKLTNIIKIYLMILEN